MGYYDFIPTFMFVIKICFPGQDVFLQPFDSHGCNYMEYSEGGGVSRNMVGVCLSRRGYLPIVLMDLGRRSHGLRAYFYNSPHFNLPEMCLLSLSGQLPYF